MKAALLGLGGLVAATVVGAGVYAANSGGGEEEVLQDIGTPTESADAPTETATGSPSPTATGEATDAPKETSAPGRAPDGCVEGEKVYENQDLGFSFCYPADLTPTYEVQGDSEVVLVERGERGYQEFVFSIGWWQGQVMPLGDAPRWPCNTIPQVEVLDESIERMDFGSGQGKICAQTVRVKMDGRVLHTMNFAGTRADGISFSGLISREIFEEASKDSVLEEDVRRASDSLNLGSPRRLG